MLETLISSKTRIKLLLKFFLNPEIKAYLRGLEAEFGESSNAIRVELNKFEEASLLESSVEGNKKVFSANTKHPLFKSLQQMLRSYIGIEQLMDSILMKLGEVSEIYLIGDLAKGKFSERIDLLFVGNINEAFLLEILRKAESKIQKKVRYLLYNQWTYEKENPLENEKYKLLIWSK
jgi:hypothetical protein